MIIHNIEGWHASFIRIYSMDKIYPPFQKDVVKIGQGPIYDVCKVSSLNKFQWTPGPDSRNDPLAIGSDTILWSWSADRIPQTPIMIGSSDRENTKPNSLSPIESWHKSFTGKFWIEITWSWLNKKCQTDDIYSWRHNGRCGDVIYERRYESVRASSMHAHSVCSRYNTVWACHIWQVCVCD